MSIISRTSPKASIAALKDKLATGVAGVRKLLSFALPHLDWSMYNAFGGPTEDALTHELIVTVYKVPTLTAKIFNPKLVDAGTAGRRPDMFLKSTVNSFVECLVASANNRSTVLDVERLVQTRTMTLEPRTTQSSFFRNKANYPFLCSTWRIKSFQ